jgi:hypothetical protein
LVAGYFLLTHDWQAWPADIDLLTQLGRRWMNLRPPVSAPALHPNIVGGIIAVLFPPLVAITLYLHRKRSAKLLWLAVAVSVFVLFAFLFTSSRAAWISLSAALGIWLLWGLSHYIALAVRLNRKIVFIVTLAGIVGVSLWQLLSFPGGPSAVTASLPGPDNTTTRLELWRQAWRLAGDFPFTGGGLAAFAGLYSNYIRVIPFFLFGYSHNFFLDVLLEQGVLGLLSLVGVILGSAWLLLTRFGSESDPSRANNPGMRDERTDIHLFRWAVFASLMTMVLHGLVDDALYGNLGTPLLFSFPGMAVALSGDPDGVQHGLGISVVPSRGAIIIAVLFAVAGLAYLSRRVLLASWYTNLGAVEMARVELAGWPSNAWDDGRHVAALAPASDMFQRALSSNPENRTAQHRLGLVAMLRREYDDAVVHLEAAYDQDEGHRGIVKSLGYSYVWAGDLEKAVGQLAEIPEARDEMDVYSWWWGTQGRDDLAEQARSMVSRLDEAASDLVHRSLMRRIYR